MGRKDNYNLKGKQSTKGKFTQIWQRVNMFAIVPTSQYITYEPAIPVLWIHPEMSAYNCQKTCKECS